MTCRQSHAFLIITKNQPREIEFAKIRLIAQRREILAQVITVEVVLRLLELHYLTLWSSYEAVENIDILIHSA